MFQNCAPSLLGLGICLMVMALGQIALGINSALDVAMILMTMGAGGIITLAGLDWRS